MATGDRADSAQSGQLGFNDLSDSRSDIHMDALVDHSDQNVSSNSHVSEHWVHNADKSLAPQVSVLNHSQIKTTLIVRFGPSLVC